MPNSLQLTTAASPVARRRSQRAAAGVVAGYIHELSRTPAVAAAPVPAAAPEPIADSGAATAPRQSVAATGTRLRAAARRRSRGSGVSRPLIVPVACQAA